jgi:hypothetical protein
MSEFTWIKAKYSEPKVAGRYRSTHNDGAKRGKREGAHASSSSHGEYKPQNHILVLVGGRKRKWVHVKD